MQKTALKLIVPALLLLLAGTLHAQQWTDNLAPLKSNQPYTYQDYTKAFHQFWDPKEVRNGFYTDENGNRVKAPGWKQFRRWEYYQMFRVDPQTGQFPKENRIDVFQNERMLKSATALGNWTTVGPSTSSGGYSGLGRINTIGFRPGDASVLYAGSPSGGLWKSTDTGASWSPKTDNNAAMGVSDVVVFAGATTATDTVFIGTGDKDGGAVFNLNGGQSGDNNGVGILKSVNGGSTWTTTGLSFQAKDSKRISRLLVDPNNNKTMLAAVLGFYSNQGETYKTTDGGVSWSKTSNVRFIDMEYKPGSSDTVYASTPQGEVHRSVDGGTTFTKINLAFGTGRIELAVTPHAPNSVWAVVVNSATRGLDAIFKSTNGGDSWVYQFQANAAGKYLLGYECDASDNKGQGEYDLYLAVDPTDSMKVYLGGVNQYRSTDGGLSWTLSSHWSNPSCSTPVDVVHADQHFCAVHPVSGHIWTGNDGGVYRSTDDGVSWEWKGDGLAINQIYRISVAQSAANHFLTGSQDNGSKAYNGTWSDEIGGDGADNGIDHTDENIQYASSEGGTVYKTTDGWATPNGTDITTGKGLTGKGAWITPFVINPQHPNTLLLGYKQLYRSKNGGSNWASMGLNTAGNYDSYIHSIAYAPSDTNTIYVANTDNTVGSIFSSIRKTTNDGANWTDVTNGLPVSSSVITGLAVHHEHADTLWVSFGQYNEHGVYQSFDGGTTWTNISTGLPQVPIMGIVENKLAASGMELYAATDIGVYMKEGSANWTRYSTDLPNVVVSELEIYYDTITTSNSKLVAATYGRGVWTSDLYTTATPPMADFDADNRYPGVGDTITMIDKSSNVPTGWAWSFSPNNVTYLNGTDANSTNPQVKFSAEGFYEVTLTASNSAGNNAETKTAFIDVSDLPIGYCDASSNNGYAAINKVTIADIDQSSGFTPGGYADYSSPSAAVKKGEDLSLFIEVSNPDSNIDITAYIDWNRDADFDDAQEQVACTTSLNGTSETFNFAVPAWASEGRTKLRIRSKVQGTECASPCGTTGNGEVEDYSLLILDSIGTVTPVADFEAHETTVNVNHLVQFTDKSTNVPHTWAWSFSPNNIVYKNGTTSASANPVVEFTAAGAYEVTLTATNNGGSDSETKTAYMTVNPVVYCAAHGTGGIVGISNVQLGSINKTSGLSSPFYSNYTATDITDLPILSSQVINITVSNNQSANDILVWIDWNGDGDFEGANERVGARFDIGTASNVVPISFTVPGEAELGQTVMRIRTAFNAQPTQSPCGDTQYGEVEDYGINVVGGDAIWLGGTSDWNTPSNWSSNSIPNEKVNVTVPNPILGGNEPAIGYNESADVNNLTIVSGSKVVVRSNATKTGSLIVHGTSSGQVRFRRFVSGNMWHLVAPPVEGQDFWDFATHARNDIAHKDNGSGQQQYAITSYNEANDTWNAYPIADPGGNLLSGSAYSLLTTIDTALYIDGTIVNNDLSLPITNTLNGWNLLGNPYPSALKATTQADATDLLLSAANIGNLDPNYAGLYLWQPASATTGQYVIINNAGGSLPDTLDQDYIQAGQGFFVKAKSGGGTFSITRAMRSHQITVPFKSGEKQWPTIELIAESTEKRASTLLKFNNQMSTGLDVSFDAGVFKPDAKLALYSRLVEDNGVDFALQALPEDYENLIVPLGVDAPEGTGVVFTAKTEGLPMDASVWLEDKSTGSFTRLDESGAIYATTLSASQVSLGNFFLHTAFNPTLAENVRTGETDYHILADRNEQIIRIITPLEKPGVARLYDMAGRFHGIVYLKQGSDNQFEMNRVPGVYLVHIVNGRRSFSEKVVWK